MWRVCYAMWRSFHVERPSRRPWCRHEGNAKSALGLMNDDDSPTYELPPPTTELRYQYRGGLGEGGMGDVGCFRDTWIGRDVAKKVLKVGDPACRHDAIRRFLHEARVQAQLEHPAIVPVYELGFEDDGTPYFLMKKVRGQSLLDILRGHRRRDPTLLEQFPQRRLLAALLTVCRAMELAHSRDVVHRDLKPANIMLGEYGEVYVVDWGLAKLVGEPTTVDHDAPPIDPSPGVTGAGSILGTPGYMAPEQFLGASSDVGARSDVYALGLLLFEVLTSQRYYQPSTFAEMRRETLFGTVKRPSEHAPHREIPPELDAICERALCMDQDERYGDAGGLADDLARYLDGDRDLAARRAVSEARLGEAKEHLAREVDSESDESVQRSRAIRAVTTALAFNPDAREARALLVDMLTRPPRSVPESARAQLRESELRHQRRAARLAAWVYLSFALYLPFPLWMGVKSPLLFALLVVCVGGCALWSHHLARNPPGPAGVPLGHLGLATSTVMVAATMVGPFVLTPMLALANTLIYIASGSRTRRVEVVVMGCLAVIVPWAAQTAGWIPASTVFEHGRVVLTPVMLELPTWATTVFLLVSNIMIHLTGAYYVSRLRDGVLDAELELRLRAWQLDQIVADDPQVGA